MLTNLMDQPIHAVAEDAAPFRSPLGVTKTRQVEEAHAADQRLSTFDGQLCRAIAATGYRGAFAPIECGPLPAEMLALPLRQLREALLDRHQQNMLRVCDRFERRLQAAAGAHYVGDIKWLDARRNTCVVRYNERHTSRTATKTREHVERHTHQLVDCTTLRLPARRMRMPRQAKRVIAALQPLWKWGYVVQGTLVDPEIEEVAVEERDSELVLAAKWVADQARAATTGGRKVSAAAGAAVLRKSRAAGSKILKEVASDPAIVLFGKFTLFGWR